MRPANSDLLIAVNEPTYVAAYPVADGWRARPLGKGDEIGQDDVIYIQEKIHRGTVDHMMAVNESFSEQCWKLKNEIRKHEEIIILMSGAFAVSMLGHLLIAAGAL